MNTKVWAHRGASAYAPENTLEAFEMAAQMHADGVELDIQLTRDGEMVVTHDEEIKRVTGQPGYVKDYTLAELKQMQFNRTHPEFDNLLKPTGLTINVELKTGIFWYKGIEEKALQLTKDLGMEEAVVYSSFNHYTLVHMRKLDPSIRTGLLYSDDWIDVFPYAKNTQKAHAFGLETHVWTVNDEEYMKLCAKMGTEAIITNKPDLCREVLTAAEK